MTAYTCDTHQVLTLVCCPRSCSHQREPVGSISLHTGLVLAGLSEERMCALGIAQKTATQVHMAWTRGGAHREGVELFERFRRFNLTMQMRTDDPIHKAHLDGMRDTTSDHPITREWVRSLRQLTAADVQEDGDWRFTEIATLSNLERQTINVAQVKAFAKHHGLPLIMWKKKLDAANVRSMLLNTAELAILYANEPGLIGYHVKGCPAYIDFNIATSRGLVNGCRATMDSLTLAEGSPTIEELLAELPAHETELWLAEPPLTVNMVPDLPPDEAYMMITAGLSLRTDLLVIPVPIHSYAKTAKLRSVQVALHGLPSEIKILDHQFDLGFALTDFKLQSRTKTKLILSLRARKTRPFYTLNSIYVLASRVRLAEQLRVIGFDPQRDDPSHLTSLQHPPLLGIWEASYRNGHEWSAELRDAAITKSLGGEPAAPLDDIADHFEDNVMHMES